jgi:hypothetical protein
MSKMAPPRCRISNARTIINNANICGINNILSEGHTIGYVLVHFIKNSIYAADFVELDMILNGFSSELPAGVALSEDNPVFLNHLIRLKIVGIKAFPA